VRHLSNTRNLKHTHSFREKIIKLSSRFPDEMLLVMWEFFGDDMKFTSYSIDILPVTVPSSDWLRIISNQPFRHGSNRNVGENSMINGSTTYEIRIAIHSEEAELYSRSRRITTVAGISKDAPRDVKFAETNLPSTLVISWRVRYI